jgi:hypothetical protein
MRARWLIIGTWLMAGALVGCSNCSDEVDAANAFLEDPANLVCQSDGDCAVVSTGCAGPARAVCGQAPLNAEAAASGKWQRISEGLAECDNSCAVCELALQPECAQGFCGGPP